MNCLSGPVLYPLAVSPFSLLPASSQVSGDRMESLHCYNGLREWVPSTPCSLSPSDTLYSSFLSHSSPPDLLPLRLDALLTSLCHSTHSQFPLTTHCLLSLCLHQTFSLLSHVKTRLLFIYPCWCPCSLALYALEELPGRDTMFPLLPGVLNSKSLK